MKISDSNLNAVTTSSQQAQQAAAANGAGRAGSADKSASSRSDQVQLSSLSSALQTLTAGSPEREAQVSRLAATYQSGNYQVNSHAVGMSLISESMAMQ